MRPSVMESAGRWMVMVSVLGLAACAHPLTIAPDLNKLPDGTATRPGTIALYVSDQDRGRQVITPGGGGDKVAYYPYRELESALFKVLGRVYERVVSIASLDDVAGSNANGVSLVALPRITTQSSSDSVLTWPPTRFEVQIACVFTDAAGARITEVLVTGTGKAEFEEFKSDFSLAAKRASEEAVLRFHKAILEDANLKRASAAPGIQPGAGSRPQP